MNTVSPQRIDLSTWSDLEKSANCSVKRSRKQRRCLPISQISECAVMKIGMRNYVDRKVRPKSTS